MSDKKRQLAASWMDQNCSGAVSGTPVRIANAVSCFLKAGINQILSVLKLSDFVLINKRHPDVLRVM